MKRELSILLSVMVLFLSPSFSLAASDILKTPTGTVLDRDVYYPGTEELGHDEMRVIACGTGMPNARPKQAASCWLVELGNGDKFIFDIGLGSTERIAAMKIPYDYLDKVFIGLFICTENCPRICIENCPTLRA